MYKRVKIVYLFKCKCNDKMLIKIVITLESLVKYKAKVTFVDGDKTIKEYISNIKLDNSSIININDVVSVDAGKGFTSMDNFDKDCLDLVKFADIEKSYGNMPHVLVKLNCKENNEETLDDDDVNNVPNNKPTHTLMDFAREACHFPKLNHLENRTCMKHSSRVATLLMTFQNRFSFVVVSPHHREGISYSTMLSSCRSRLSGVQRSELEPFTSFVKSVRDIIWYISPHKIKFHNNGCSVPQLFSKCCLLNNPKRHGHKVENLDSTKLLTLTSTVTGELKKTWINRSSHCRLKQTIDELVEAGVKYKDHLRSSLDYMQTYHSLDNEPEYEKAASSFIS